MGSRFLAQPPLERGVRNQEETMYHLCKQTRIYDGYPYRGPTSDGMPAEYEKLEEAKNAQADFNERNPVGWNIYYSETGKLVDGVDCHGEMSSNAGIER